MSERNELIVFCVAALAITAGLQLPFLQAGLAGVAPPGWSMPLVGLSAFGPALAVLVVKLACRPAAPLLTHWRAPPPWILLALITPALLHMPGQLIERALGGSPAAWLSPPSAPEMVAAMLVFPLGEELGWRGHAWPRFAAQLGPLRGALALGLVWFAWHIPSFWFPGAAPPTPAGLLAWLVEICALSVIFAWFAERSGRGLLVAIALHVGIHLDNVARLPASEWRLRLLHVGVLVVVAALAARGLVRTPAGSAAR